MYIQPKTQVPIVKVAEKYGEGNAGIAMLARSTASILFGDLLLCFSSDGERLWGKPGRVTWVQLDAQVTLSALPWSWQALLLRGILSKRVLLYPRILLGWLNALILRTILSFLYGPIARSIA